jgi:hypothetical protein
MILNPDWQYPTPSRLELPKLTNHITSPLKQIGYFLQPVDDIIVRKFVCLYIGLDNKLA